MRWHGQEPGEICGLVTGGGRVADDLFGCFGLVDGLTESFAVCGCFGVLVVVMTVSLVVVVELVVHVIVVVGISVSCHW